MNLRLRLTFIIISLLSLLHAKALEFQADSTLLSKAPRISLLTARAGAEIYQLEGHSALRIQDPVRGDYVVNWGLFDFAAPNFVYRFVKGETDYMAGATDTRRFLELYRREGREVVEQKLNLSPEEALEVRNLTDINLQPENRSYRYNYVLDNCATRPLAIIEKAIGDTLRLSGSGLPSEAGKSFRDAMRHYHRNYAWYQFGIDLALGSGIDRPISKRELSFSPEALESMLSRATRPSGMAIVSDSHTIVESDAPSAILAPTPALLTPMFWSIVVFIIAILCSIGQLRHGSLTLSCRIFDTTFFSFSGICGLILTFLIFVSVHEATSPNWLYLWLNPCCFAGAVLVWSKRWEKLLISYQFVNFALLIALSVAFICHAQSPNPAFIPLIAADGVRALSCIIANRKSGCHHAKAVK